MRILLTEDDRRMSALLQRGLSEEGHVVERVATGRETLHALGTAEFDVVHLHSVFLWPTLAAARAAERDRTATPTPRRMAARAAAKALPPVPTTSQSPAGSPKRSHALPIPMESVSSPIKTPSSAQKVLHPGSWLPPGAVTTEAASRLWGTVTLPPPPAKARVRMVAARSTAAHRRGTYTASRPKAPKAALCIAGEIEWATGSPNSPYTFVVGAIESKR